MSSSVGQLHEIIINLGDKNDYDRDRVQLFMLLDNIKNDIERKNITAKDINRDYKEMTPILMSSLDGNEYEDNVDTLHELWLALRRQHNYAYTKDENNREKFQYTPLKDFFQTIPAGKYVDRTKSTARARKLRRSKTSMHPLGTGKRKKSRRGKKCKKSKKRRH